MGDQRPARKEHLANAQRDNSGKAGVMLPGSSLTTSELNSADEPPDDERSAVLGSGFEQPGVPLVLHHALPACAAVPVITSAAFCGIRSHAYRGAEGCL